MELRIGDAGLDRPAGAGADFFRSLSVTLGDDAVGCEELSAAHDAIARHGSLSLDVEPGTGTTFVITLPVQTD